MNGYYLDIPRDYCQPFGGLRWSALAEAIESDDGRTFALTPQLLAFLEGFVSRRPLIPFGHILHFLYLLRQRKTARHDFTTLSMAWQEAGRPSRTAGVVCALLCPEVPVALNPPQLDELAGWLNVWGRVSVRPIMPGDEPELDADLFESLLAVELASYSFSDLLHWFRHGQAPVAGEGESLAEALLADKPRSLAEVLAQVSRHDRLSGAVPFVSSLIGALTLPPRRRQSREIPLGGIADITTKGRPEAILPGQFALDEWEFLRRFAQNELLYFRREDPAVQAREELVILLDQGVRTWGAVRVLLAAAVFALGQMAQRRELSFRLALTSTGGRSFDPLTLDASELADKLGQSDLTGSPAEALNTLAREATPGARDIVLLTHPRNRDEPQTLAACENLGPENRLFALTADAEGSIELSELRVGGVVSISRCRVDLERVAPPPRPAPATTPDWTGAVEPVGHPFRFGLAGHQEPVLFAFDQAGEWLLVLSQPDTLLAMRTDGSAHETLPRPMLRDQLLGNYTGVIGVEGGFALTAHCDSAPVAAYYHFPSRSCRVIVMHATVAENVRWRFIRRANALAVISGDDARWVRLSAACPDEPLPASLLWPVPVATQTRLPLPAQEMDRGESSHAGWREPSLEIEPGKGVLRLTNSAFPWEPFSPLEEGRPVFESSVPLRGVCRHKTLAVLFKKPGSISNYLCLFEGPGGSPLGRLELPINHDQFTLSPDGRLLAVQRGQGQLQVRDTGPTLGIRCVTPVGRFHNNLVVDLGDACLRLIIGQTTHSIDWNTGKLNCTTDRTPTDEAMFQELQANALFRARPDGPTNPVLSIDAARFRATARNHKLMIAAVTKVGEVFLFDKEGTLIAGFFVFRQELAAWMPGGTRFGSETLLGQGSTPDADLHLGAALLAASKGRWIHA